MNTLAKIARILPGKSKAASSNSAAKYMGSSEWRWVAHRVTIRLVLGADRIELCGEVPERSNGAVSKCACKRARPSG
jgi:hypothetical protein